MIDIQHRLSVLIGMVIVSMAALWIGMSEAALAHAGHGVHRSNGDKVTESGRIPGQPDFVKIGRETRRFDPETKTYEIKMPGRPTGRTHHDAAGNIGELPSNESNPTCATSGHRIVVVRTYFAAGSPTEEPYGKIRSIIRRMNWKMEQQALRSSDEQRSLSLVVDCDESGQIAVHDVEVPANYKGDGIDTTDGKVNSYDAANSAIRALGLPEDVGGGKHDHTRAVKYLVLHDDSGPGVTGLALTYPDPDKSALDENVEEANNHRIFTSWAVSRILQPTNTHLHELLHVMGATWGFWLPGYPPPAPFANESGHCNDGIDVLCYGPLEEYSNDHCPASQGYDTPLGKPIDCNFDTYFDAKAEPGEWLDTYWNLGGAENPYLRATTGPGIPEEDSDGNNWSTVEATSSASGLPCHRYLGEFHCDISSEGQSDWDWYFDASVPYGTQHCRVQIKDGGIEEGGEVIIEDAVQTREFPWGWQQSNACGEGSGYEQWAFAGFPWKGQVCVHQPTGNMWVRQEITRGAGAYEDRTIVAFGKVTVEGEQVSSLRFGDSPSGSFWTFMTDPSKLGVRGEFPIESLPTMVPPAGEGDCGWPELSSISVSDVSTEETCDPATLSGTTVSGGCLVSGFEGEFELKLGATYLGNYDGEFDLVIGANGEFFAIDQGVAQTKGSFGRDVCRTTANGPKIPWAGQLTEVGPGEYEAEMKVCLSPVGVAAGTTETIVADVDLIESGAGGMELDQGIATGWFRNGSWSSPNGVYIEPVY